MFPGTDPFQYRSCDPPFANNFPYLVTTAFVEFFTPFFSITILNLLVYMNIRQRSRGLIRSDDHATKKLSIRSIRNSFVRRSNQSSVENGKNESNHEKLISNGELDGILTNTKNSHLPVTTTFSKSSTAALARDRKAAKNLFIFVFVFSICWFPYTFFSLIRAVCHEPDSCVSSSVYEVTFWLLWLNSTINPLLYSFLHVKFRKAFCRILCFYNRRGSQSQRLRTN